VVNQDIVQLKEDIRQINITLFQQGVSIRTMSDQLHAVELAFPDGTQSHRSAHQAMIDAAEEEKAFYRMLRHEAAKKGLAGLWYVFCTLFGLAIIGFAVKMGINWRDVV
jgi:hypothetical protein